MCARKRNSIPEEKETLYDALIATMPDIKRRGATMPYTSINGHMFSYLESDGTMALRLDEKEREAFIKKHKTELMVSRGKVMKEYAKVPSALLEDTNTMTEYLALSYKYVSSLKPKPTKKKK